MQGSYVRSKEEEMRDVAAAEPVTKLVSGKLYPFDGFSCYYLDGFPGLMLPPAGISSQLAKSATEARRIYKAVGSQLITGKVTDLVVRGHGNLAVSIIPEVRKLHIPVLIVPLRNLEFVEGKEYFRMADYSIGSITIPPVLVARAIADTWLHAQQLHLRLLQRCLDVSRLKAPCEIDYPTRHSRIPVTIMPRTGATLMRIVPR